MLSKTLLSTVAQTHTANAGILRSPKALFNEAERLRVVLNAKFVSNNLTKAS